MQHFFCTKVCEKFKNFWCKTSWFLRFNSTDNIKIAHGKQSINGSRKIGVQTSFSTRNMYFDPQQQFLYFLFFFGGLLVYWSLFGCGCFCVRLWRWYNLIIEETFAFCYLRVDLFKDNTSNNCCSTKVTKVGSHRRLERSTLFSETGAEKAETTKGPENQNKIWKKYIIQTILQIKN